MKLFLTTTGHDYLPDGSDIRTLLASESQPNCLFSYAYRQLEPKWEACWNQLIIKHVNNTRTD